MNYTTVRVSADTLGLLRDLARKDGKPMRATLAKAIEAYRRQRFLEAVNAGFASVRRHPRTWGALEAERAAWDVTLADGLEAGAVARSTRGTQLSKHRRIKA